MAGSFDDRRTGVASNQQIGECFGRGMSQIAMQPLHCPQSVSTMFRMQFDQVPSGFRGADCQSGFPAVRWFRKRDCSSQCGSKARLIIFHVGRARTKARGTSFQAAVRMAMLASKMKYFSNCLLCRLDPSGFLCQSPLAIIIKALCSVSALVKLGRIAR